MEASPHRVIDYFNGEKQNIIPLFQRPYTWVERDWQTLWDDMMVQYDLEETSTHFLGAIVSLPARSVPVGVSKYLIIDGQQRLTTISILLCALRDSLDLLSRSRIQEVYLTNRFREAEDTLKLVPTQSDREIYSQLILGGLPEFSDNNIFRAYRFFLRALSHSLDGDGERVIGSRVLNTIEQKLQVVMINLDEADDPYLIFESLNAKGEPLTQADLVRNYILMRFRHSIAVGGEQSRIYTTYWRPLELMLGDAMTDFLRADAMKSGENIRQGGIYAATKARFKGVSSDELTEDLLRSMLASGSIYQKIINPAFEPNPIVQEKLRRLEDFQIRTSYPLLLRLFTVHEAGKMEQEDLISCLSYIESFAVRRTVCGVPTNQLNKLFLQWCRAFPQDNHMNWLRNTLESGTAGRRWPSDAEFSREFKFQPQYPRGATPFILRLLEGTYEHHELVDLSTTSIEHILPQTITHEWKQELGESYSTDHDELLHTFGNLTLTGYNAELGNHSFEEKKFSLRNTHIELNRWIIEQQRWTRSEIEQRAALLCERAIRLWPGPTQPSVPDSAFIEH